MQFIYLSIYIKKLLPIFASLLIMANCGGSDITKPENMQNYDLNKEIGSGQAVKSNVTVQSGNFIGVLDIISNSGIAGADASGTGLIITDVISVRSSAGISAGAYTTYKNDIGGVYQISNINSSVTNATVVYRYKLRNALGSSNSPPIKTPDMVGHITATSSASLNLVSQMNLSVNNLAGKSYFIGLTTNGMNYDYKGGVIPVSGAISFNTGNILYKYYKIWIY